MDSTNSNRKPGNSKNTRRNMDSTNSNGKPGISKTQETRPLCDKCSHGNKSSRSTSGISSNQSGTRTSTVVIVSPKEELNIRKNTHRIQTIRY